MPYKGKERKEGEPLQLKVVLDGEMAERFLTIKKRFGFESNSDLIRMIITKAYEEMKRQDYQ
jgi:hypothetical protein